MLDRKEHAGNYYPARLPESKRRELVERGARLAMVMREDGFVGDFGLDVMETPYVDLPFVECNPRNTGQTPLAHASVRLQQEDLDSRGLEDVLGEGFLTLRNEISTIDSRLLDRFGQGDVTKQFHIASVNVQTGKGKFRHLEEALGPLLYQPGQSFGVIPQNMGPFMQHGKFSMVVYGQNQRDFRMAMLLAAQRVGMKNMQVLV